MTPQEAKEQFIQTLMDKIKDRFSESQLVTTLSTCDAPNWDKNEFAYMPIVADRLRIEGYGVTSMVRHGVTDWTISV